MDRIGKYILQGELGKGAMGVVYRGLDPYIERPVAVKTIRFDLFNDPAEQEQAQVRFMREARSAGILSHPGIVTIYEVGEDLGLTYIAMEFIEGQSLDKLLASGKKLNFKDVVGMIAAIGDALDYAHRKGVIHRDIKPGNILIDKEGLPHLVDFGIARLAASTLTITRAVLGTPFYMSPEQIMGKRVDHRTDIFSLGTILYELITGQKPFPGESLTTVIYKIMNENPPPASMHKKDLPEGLDRIISRTIAKNPAARYQCCSDLSRDLRRVAGSRPSPEAALKTVLPESSRPEKAEIPKESRDRRRRPLLFAVAVMMAVVAIAVVSLYYHYSQKGSQPRFPGDDGSPPSVSASAEKEKAGESPKSQDIETPQIEPAEQATEATIDRPEHKPAGEPEAAALQKKPENLIVPEKQRPEPVKPEDEAPQKPEQKAPPLPRPKEVAGEKEKETGQRTETAPDTEERKAPYLDKIYDDGIAALKERRYDVCIRSMEEILQLEPGHKNAQYYLAIARKRREDGQKQKSEESRKAAEVALHLRAAEEMLRAEDYKGGLAEARETLRLDPGNQTAREQIRLAETKLAEVEIRALVDAYVRAVSTKELLAFYQAYCYADLYQIISRDAGVLLKLYDDLQVMASQLRMDVQPADGDHAWAEVRFAQIMTGVSAAKKTREVLFEGTINWKIEKKSGNWRILNITYQTADQKPPGKERT
ncbi:MAG: protein kinase [Candidatus Aminicenantales bacterium]